MMKILQNISLRDKKILEDVMRSDRLCISKAFEQQKSDLKKITKEKNHVSVAYKFYDL